MQQISFNKQHDDDGEHIKMSFEYLKDIGEINTLKKALNLIKKLAIIKPDYHSSSIFQEIIDLQKDESIIMLQNKKSLNQQTFQLSRLVSNENHQYFIDEYRKVPRGFQQMITISMKDMKKKLFIYTCLSHPFNRLIIRVE